ncbi:MAG: TlpA disulfide reductase family protein [Thiohalomonadales bacterium]
MQQSLWQSMKTVLLGLMVVVFLLVTSQSSAKVAEGLAPDFTLKSLSGDNFKLSEYRGRVVLINFWASWSGSSRQELPLLNALYKRFRDKDLVMVGVNVEKDISNARSLLKDVAVSFPILMDTRNKVSALYKVDAMPSTVIVDRDGNMRYLHNGYSEGAEDEYQKQVRELMRE